LCQDFRSTRSASSAHTGKSSTKNKEVYIRNICKARNTILALVAGIQIIVVEAVVVAAEVVLAAVAAAVISTSGGSIGDCSGRSSK
jgi:hypothetical protein